MYSPLVDEVMLPTGRYNGQRKWSPRPDGAKIEGLVVHHHATTSNAGIDRLVKSNDPASANYIIRDNGNLIGSVPEEYRAWTSGSAEVDNVHITVEVQNSTGAPTWKISNAALATLVLLYADVAKRRKFEPVKSNIPGHRDFAATACPGPYLYPKLGEVAQKAAALNGNIEKPKPPTPSKPTPPTSNKLIVDGFWGKAVTRRAQKLLGTTVDGVISNQTEAWRSNQGLTTGWDWTGEAEDGGSEFVRKHQELLRSRRLYLGKIDGKIGPLYITALQKDVGTYPDGRIGYRSATVKKFQQKLNSGRI